MKEFKIRLSTVNEVHRFVSTITPFRSDFDLMLGRYVIDAKSIMGIFGFNLQEELTLKVYDCTEEIERAIEPFLS